MLLHPALLISLLALPTTILATTTTTSPPPTLKTATLYAHPVSPTPSAPSTLAILTYAPTHPHLSTLKSFTPPANSSDPDALTSVLVYPDGQTSGDGYRSTVTATYGFHAPYKGRFRVLLDREGVVVGASWHSYLPRSPPVAGKGNGKGKGKGESVENGRGDFSILTTKPAPSVVFDKVAKGTAGATGAGTGAGMGGQEGEGEVVEKTFLQKYWWVLLGVAVLAMTGGGDK